GDAELVIRSTSGTQEWKFQPGEGAGAAATFSADSAWAGMTIAPTRAVAQANTRARRPNQNNVMLVNLANGEKTTINKIRRFAFSGEAGGWVALHRYGATSATGAGPAVPAPGGPPVPPPPGGATGGATPPRDTAPRGTDLILRDLKAGSELIIGNVSEWGFNKNGRYLAMVIDAADQIGNGIQIRDMQTGVITPLETSTSFYERMSWTEEGDAIIFFKGKDDRQYRERLFGIVGYKGFDKGQPVRVAYDPMEDKSLPADMGISSNRSPQWTEARDAFIFGIAKLTKTPAPAGGRGAGTGVPAAGTDSGRSGGASAGPDETPAPRPNLVIWHYKDPRLQTQQQVQEASDRALNYVTMYRTDEKKLVRLADEEVPSVAVNARTRWAIATVTAPYELDANLNGQRFMDIYAVDTKTGQRKVVRKHLRWGNGASPDGAKYLFYENQHFYVFDAETGTERNITLGIPTSFVDTEDDHNIVDPPTGTLGWTSDNAYVLLSDNWDIWKVPVAAGQQAVNLTVNGKKDKIRYLTRVRTDLQERGADMSRRQIFSVFGEMTKKSGYGALEPNTTGLKMLLWDDAQIGALTKAEKADVWTYRRETPTEAPAYYVTDASLANGRKFVDTSAEAAPYLWTSGVQLLTYSNNHPDPKKRQMLQASLYLPANYEKGKTYPMVVYIYELQTQGHNTFGRPTANGFSRQAYTSNGYAVLMPDIRYYVNDPGMSAVWALEPAVDAAVKAGVADPKRVGLHGHSWGGYQTAFTITQSRKFAAAIAGAPLTDMISMYSIIYKNSGGTNGAIFEASQGRFTTGPWDNWQAYTRNSPVAFAKNVTTPLMILHNDQDGAVDFTQGMEYFNTLRRLNKPVVLLEYPGENHGLAKPENQQDYTERMKEFFDHYLKDAASPDWLEYGVPRLKMQEHIDQRLKARADREKAKNPPTPAPGSRGGGGGR
ncbi:MAG TPA: prolyl oligopeptidase family serine peptidase, partial [Vicinamibacterales bacterium]|nr:prolyl oligopeptidase family serine peptidase [Vicinamibacterales bacterium]